MNMTNHPFLLSVTDNYSVQIKDIEKLIRLQLFLLKEMGLKLL